MASNKVEIEVGVNVKGEQGITSLGHSLDSTGTAAKKLGADATGAASGVGSADNAAKGLTATSGKLRDGLESVSVQLANAKSELLQLVGIGAGVQGVKDISALADSYKNLEARIKLTTGEGKAFDTAFTGVFDVAKRTSSAVEETGLLFTKLAEAGKTLGVSQSEALKLTETINQTIQLSGASAEASKASITQLVQGLQSGVLRGDEFNSVMEQSPRLAKALGDGLSVTTGELRKMAEEGKLTSDVIIKALQGQSDAVASEFGKLPATVGRAMTNLTTAFTAYVGEADKAGGYTSKLATVIDALAGNLGTVANAMIHTGQTLGAMKLLTMAQDWLAASAAIKATAAATETATASTLKSTVATLQNTTVTAANTVAQVTNAAAWGDVATKLGGVGPKLTEVGTVAANAASKTSLLSGAVGALSKVLFPLAVLDIALNFKQYGTAIGEGAAKLLGFKDRTEELARSEKTATLIAEENVAMRKRMAAATQLAIEKQFELSKASSAALAEFEKLTKEGSTAADAIAKIGKDFDLASVPGIKNAAAVLDKLATDGKLSASQVKVAWADALKGADLAVFETQARAAFAGTAREAERLAQVMDATLRESVKRTGLDFDVISGGMSKASRSAINDTEAMINGLDRLKAMGVDTAQALTASLGKGISTADSQKAIEAVRLQIESMRKALGDKVTDGLLDQAKQKALELKDALDKATPGITSVREAMKALGVTSDQTFKDAATQSKAAYDAMKSSGTSSARELADGFKKMAADQIVASGQVGSIQRAVTEETLKTEGAVRGLSVAFDASGKMIVQTQAEAAAAIAKTAGALGGQKEAIDSVTSALERQIEVQKRKIKVQEDLDELERKRLKVDKEGFSTDKSGNRINAGGDLTSRTGIKAFLKSAGVTDDATATSITNEFSNSKGDIDYLNNSGQMKYGGAGSTISQALLKAAEMFTFSEKNKAQITNPDAASAKTVNVKITLPDGSTQTVPTTQNGSAALIAALQSAKLSAGL